jgi:AcrR family transcriptional regulator
MVRTGRPREFDRQEALHAALTLFWRQGYEPTSLNQLKEVMGGISPTSFYAAFGSKERLFLEVLDLYRSSHGQVTDVLHDASISPRRAIETCLKQSALMQTNASHPLGCLIVLGASNSGPSSDEVVRALKDERDRNRLAIAAQIQRAISKGDLPEKTDAVALTTLFNTFLVGLSTAARDGASKEQLLRSVDMIMQLWPSR